MDSINSKSIFERHAFLFFIFLLLFSLTPLSAFAGTETITYEYYNDTHNTRALKKAIYVNKVSFEYVYDGSGNRTQQTVTALFPDISPNPSSLGFGNVHVGETSAPQTVTVTNNGTAGDLVIGALSLTGANASEFLKQSDTCSGATVPPSGTCDVQIAFSPAGPGSRDAVLSIPSNDPDTPTVEIPLNGNGVFLLTILKDGNTAAGTVTGPGIDCGTDCTEFFNSGTQVTLTASTAGFNCSVFAGWTGGGCSGTGSCVTTINADTTITATFNYPMPVSNFIGSPLQGKSPVTVNFTDQSTCPTAWSWTFGDGGTSTLQNPSHQYSYQFPLGQFSKSYTVSLTASNASGPDTLTRTNYITLQCPNDPARIVRTNVKYTSIQAAYNAAINGDTIQVQAVTRIENPTFNQAKTVTIDGGYDCYYSTKIGNTVIRGNVTNSNGSATMGSIQITQ